MTKRLNFSIVVLALITIISCSKEVPELNPNNEKQTRHQTSCKLYNLDGINFTVHNAGDVACFPSGNKYQCKENTWVKYTGPTCTFEVTYGTQEPTIGKYTPQKEK